MLIKSCRGYELEKEKSNTSEDFFNRSELIFEEGGQERIFRVLYVRYFEEMFHEFTPYQQNPIFKVGNREVELKDIVALACLIQNPVYRDRKQVYINTKSDFSRCFEGLNFDKLPIIFQELEEKKASILRSPLDYIVQPN